MDKDQKKYITILVVVLVFVWLGRGKNDKEWE